MCHDLSGLQRLKDEFEKNSVLTFSYEVSDIKQQLAFLDVLITRTANGFHTGVYIKPTDGGACMNGDSNCPERYKKSVINSYLTRAFAVSEDWITFDSELERIKKLLINNSYSNGLVDEVIKTFLQKKTISRAYEDGRAKESSIIPLFYRAQMHTNYMADENVLRDIVRNNVKTLNSSTHRLKLHIYYNNRKSQNMIMQNSPMKTDFLHRTNVVYSFICPFQHQHPESYIGHTRTTLARRLTMHVQGGSVAAHIADQHGMRATRNILDSNTKIIAVDSDPHRLKIKEALYILQCRPSMNKQDDRFNLTLQLFTDSSRGIYTVMTKQGAADNRIGTHASVPEYSTQLLKTKNDFSFEKSPEELTSVVHEVVPSVSDGCCTFDKLQVDCGDTTEGMEFNCGPEETVVVAGKNSVLGGLTMCGVVNVLNKIVGSREHGDSGRWTDDRLQDKDRVADFHDTVGATEPYCDSDEICSVAVETSVLDCETGSMVADVFGKIDGPKEYSDSSGKYIDENTQNEGIANVIQAPPPCECMIGHCGLNVASGDSPPLVGCDELRRLTPGQS